MLTKESSLFLFFAIILLNYINNECEAIQCYSCSDCGNSPKGNWSIIRTVNSGDQCIKATISTQGTISGQKLSYRGASSKCRSYVGRESSIYCCSSDLCNE